MYSYSAAKKINLFGLLEKSSWAKYSVVSWSVCYQAGGGVLPIQGIYLCVSINNQNAKELIILHHSETGTSDIYCHFLFQNWYFIFRFLAIIYTLVEIWMG